MIINLEESAPDFNVIRMVLNDLTAIRVILDLILKY